MASRSAHQPGGSTPRALRAASTSTRPERTRTAPYPAGRPHPTAASRASCRASTQQGRRGRRRRRAEPQGADRDRRAPCEYPPSELESMRFQGRRAGDRKVRQMRARWWLVVLFGDVPLGVSGLTPGATLRRRLLVTPRRSMQSAPSESSVAERQQLWPRHHHAGGARSRDETGGLA